MLLTIRTTHTPATDLGFLLHKHPEHVHTRDFPFGNAVVFYPEATADACTAAILLDVDPVGTVRGRDGKSGVEDQYVNDRPYVASSLEGLERFVQREPLRRVHECVFGVLALESEPVDPRL
jgi:RNA repair, ligase-Pnkp-associating, region of Hen1/PNKP adenylyltransferase domain, ligase domain